MTKSLIRSRKLQFARIFLHQMLETLQGDNFSQSHVNGFRPGFRPEDFDGLVSEVGIEADRCHGYSQNATPFRIYILLLSYIRINSVLICHRAPAAAMIRHA